MWSIKKSSISVSVCNRDTIGDDERRDGDLADRERDLERERL